MAGKGIEERERALAALGAVDLSAIVDPGIRQGFVLLLNLVEELRQENLTLRAEVQRLRDEIGRLKGQSGRPQFPKQKGKVRRTESGNYSSEAERAAFREEKVWRKGSKQAQIRIDREEVLAVDPESLPVDAEFKGYEAVVVQDVVFQTDNTRFQKEKYYSSRTRRTYLAPLPEGYRGGYGPGVRALVLALYFGGQMSEPKIGELLANIGVLISAGQVSNLLIQDQERFHAEKRAVVVAGLGSSPWQHLDDTGTRVNGEQHYCQVLCNPLYTAYATGKTKDRQAILDVLRSGRPRSYLWNDQAEAYLETVGLSATVRRQLGKLPRDQMLGVDGLAVWLAEHLPNLGPQQRKWLEDALAIAAYQAEQEPMAVKLLVCDDAPQFAGVTQELALCWIHEGRHYKKLSPYFPSHRQLWTEFLDRFWDYYRELLSYRHQPSPAERTRLRAAFDTLFATKTDYWELDQRIALTRAKKEALLRVLDHPEIPLHNNPAELGARQRVRKRDVSFGPRTPAGAQAWDTFMTLAATATKLGVSFYAYLQDRVSQTYALPSLASLIQARAPNLHLGASWHPL